MVQDPFASGVQVVHKKMQVIGSVAKLDGDLVHVKFAPNMPIKICKKEDLVFWDGRAEIQKKLKQGGYIRNIYKKMVN